VKQGHYTRRRTARGILTSVAMLLCAYRTDAHAGCSRALTASFVSAERLVDSLRPEKAGIARVFAFDGSEYTAGEAIWMKGKLRAVLADCLHNDEARAFPDLEEVLRLMRSHHRPSDPGTRVTQGR
jgi:hypothetical protein